MALPRLPRGAVWEKAFSTESGETGRKTVAKEEKDTEFVRNVPPRSVAVYISVPE